MPEIVIEPARPPLEGDIVIDAEDGHGDPASPSVAGGLERAVRDWRMAEALEVLRLQINTLAPRRSKASDGGIGDAAHAARNSDHNPQIIDGARGVVTARDFTHDPAGGCDGEVLAESLRASRDPRIKYIIWNRRICAATPQDGQPAWAWRAYGGRNPHTKHVHLSVSAAKALYDDARQWAVRINAAAPAPPTPTRALEGSGADDAAFLEAATRELERLAPLGRRLVDLQQSSDAAIAGRAARLLAQVHALSAERRPRPAPVTAPPDDRSYATLAPRYTELYSTCSIRSEYRDQVAWHRRKLLDFQDRYRPVADATGAPWWFIGIVHALESSFNFTTHLHNGDPLTAPTVHHPAGRPPGWTAPGNWDASAIDALGHEGLAGLGDWDLTHTLHRFEGYNGFSYYQHAINSPYLWSFSNHYEKGKFVADHVYNADAVSRQCGAAVMLKALIDAGDIQVPASRS